MGSVSEMAKKLNRKWKEDVLTDGNFTKEVSRLPVGDLGFDYPLYGGLPEGAITVFSGVEHSGKTVAACTAMAQYQKRYPEKTCIYVDAENTLLTQGEFLSRITGLSLSSDVFLRYDMTGKSAEEMFTDILQLQEADDIGMIVIDSAPALISQADLDNEFMKDNGQRASIAKSLGKFLKQMIMYLPKRNNILLIINQVRVDGTNFMGAKIYSEPCGYSLGYYPSMKVRFGTRTYTLGDKTDISSSKGEGADGFRLKFSITKNRLGPTDRGGGFMTYRLATGIDKIHDMLEVALKYEYIKRPTTQSYILWDLDKDEIQDRTLKTSAYIDENGEELKFVGKSKVIEYINTHEEFKEKYFEMLTRFVSQSSVKINLLDDVTMNEILQQEASVNKEKFVDNPIDGDEEND